MHLFTIALAKSACATCGHPTPGAIGSTVERICGAPGYCHSLLDDQYPDTDVGVCGCHAGCHQPAPKRRRGDRVRQVGASS